MNSSISKKEFAYQRRMDSELRRIRPIVSDLNDRLKDQLEATGRTICGVFGVMDGDTKPSAYIAVTEPRTVRGVRIEHSVLETHRAALVLDFFGLEA